MSSKPKSLRLNFIMNAILTVSSFLFPIITFPYVSRVLMPDGTGKVNLAISVATYFSMLAQLGIPTYGIRICSQESDDKIQLSRTVQELLIINSVMSAFSYIVFAIMLFTVPKFSDDKALYIIVSSIVLFNTIGAEWLYRAIEQYKYITIRSIIFKTVALIATFILIKKPDDYIIYGGISIFASSASNILNFINLRKHVFMRPMGEYDFKRHFRAIFIFFAMSCATTVYTNLDTVMLGFMKTDDQVGFYTAAVKIKTILVSLITSLGTVLMPRATYFIAHNKIKEFYSISKKAINFVMLTAIPFTVYFIIFAREGIMFLSGGAFEGAIVPMQIIMPTLLFIGLSNITGIQMLVPLGKENMVLLSEIVGAIVDLIINIILIPPMGAVGAAIGTLVAEVAVLLVQYFALHGSVNDALKSVRYITVTIGVALGSVASLWVKQLELRNMFKLTISAVIFFGIYAIVLTVLKEPLTVEIEGQAIKKIKSFLHRGNKA